MADLAPRTIVTVDDARAVVASRRASLTELLECVSVGRAVEDWQLVEDAGTAALVWSTGRSPRALPSLDRAATAVVAAYLARTATLDDLGPALEAAAGVLDTAYASTSGSAAIAVDEKRRWLDELRLLYADATAASLVALCARLRDIDRADLGIEAATRAIGLDGATAPALTTRAAAFMDRSDHPHAMADIQKAWKLKPNAFTANAFSRILVAAGHPDQGLEIAQEGFRMRPDEKSAHTLLAAAVAAGDDDALAEAKEYIRSHPDLESPEPGSLWVEILAVEALLIGGRLDDAEAAIRHLERDVGAPATRLRSVKAKLSSLRRKQQGTLDVKA